MKKLLLVGLSALLTQGCVFRTGATEAAIGRGSQPVPSLADPMHASGGTAPPAGIFGRASVGTTGMNLPLPRTANPSRYFQVPGLSPKAKDAVFGTLDGTAELLCAFFSGMYDSSDPGCHRGPRRDNIHIVRHPPIINR